MIKLIICDITSSLLFYYPTLTKLYQDTFILNNKVSYLID